MTLLDRLDMYLTDRGMRGNRNRIIRLFQDFYCRGYLLEDTSDNPGGYSFEEWALSVFQDLSN